jgi:hypothetical protein
MNENKDTDLLRDGTGGHLVFKFFVERLCLCLLKLLRGSIVPIIN